jgi:hypothetical protein
MIMDNTKPTAKIVWDNQSVENRDPHVASVFYSTLDVLNGWLEKHHYYIAFTFGGVVCSVYYENLDTKAISMIAEFHEYELAVKCALDAIDKDIEKDAEDAWKYRENSK